MDIKDTISSGLLELYVLGMASEQETAEVIALAKKHPEVAAEIAAIESGLETYAMMNAITPKASVKEKILTGINTTSATSASSTAKVVSISSFWKYAAAASIILLIGSAILNVVYYDKYKTVNDNYAAAVIEKNNAQDQLAAMEESNKEMKNDMGVIQSKYSEPVSLHGQPDAPDAAAKIFWMKNTTGEVYIDPSNLPEPPSGMQYQFWVRRQRPAQARRGRPRPAHHEHSRHHIHGDGRSAHRQRCRGRWACVPGDPAVGQHGLFGDRRPDHRVHPGIHLGCGNDVEHQVGHA